VMWRSREGSGSKNGPGKDNSQLLTGLVTR
jgi:hypothetical protein